MIGLLAPVFTAFLAICSSACASRAELGSDFSCYAMPAFPAISHDVDSASELVAWYAKHATADQMRVTTSAVGRVEKALAHNPEVDVEESFFKSQLLVLQGICRPTQGDTRELAAMIFVELQAAALINAANLRNQEPEMVVSVVPSDSPNLTAGMNIIVLAAGCSTREHPLLAEVLGKRNLACHFS